MNNFLITIILAGIGISIIAGPIGSLMLWRRMTYFGDTLAHSSLLGASIAVLFNLNIYYGLLVICILVAILLNIITNNNKFTNDVVLSMLSHIILAIGLISMVLLGSSKIDLLGYLYGDILSINTTDLIYIYLVDIIVIGSLIAIWDRLVLATISKELAIIEGIKEQQIRWIFIMLIALIFAVAIRLVGVLLINALLIIPNATIKIWAKNPKQMALGGSIFSCIAIILGVLWSLLWDVPTGPAIVVSAASLLLINFMLYCIIIFFKFNR